MSVMKRRLLFALCFCFNVSVYADVSRQLLADSLNAFVNTYAAVHPVRVHRCVMRNGTLRVVTNEHLAAVAYRREDIKRLKKLLRRVWGVSG